MNTRKDNNGVALKAWKKLGPALIQRPLRKIVRHQSARNEKGELVIGINGLRAIGQAQAGNGMYVKAMARHLGV